MVMVARDGIDKPLGYGTQKSTQNWHKTLSSAALRGHVATKSPYLFVTIRLRL
jgi:hypothetical protein